MDQGDQVLATVDECKRKSSSIASIDHRFVIVRGDLDRLAEPKLRAIAVACNRRFKACAADTCAKRVHERCAVAPKGKKALESAAGDLARDFTSGRSTTADVGCVYLVFISGEAELRSSQGISHVMMLRPPNLNADNPDFEESITDARKQLQTTYTRLFDAHIKL